MSTSSSPSPPGDNPEDNKPSHVDGVTPIRKTGVFIKNEDIEEPELDRSALVGLRKHNYYNAKNATKLLALVKKWQGMAFIDCNMSAAALGLSPDSLRIKLLCGKYFLQDHMTLDEDTARILKRMVVGVTSGGVMIKMAGQERDMDFEDALMPGTGVTDPCEEFSKWLEAKPRPRTMFTLRDLNLTEGQLEWFRITCSQIKAEYESDVTRQQVVVIKLI